ncbi:MAG: transaminase [Gammaproteobacteria bacterium]|nr:transaminase [Gammaproteobacteria bacterium]MDH3465299.1 transaminase [Gammaproteobacteria bacterium]
MAISDTQIDKLRARELERFIANRPRSTALWQQAQKYMPNGVPMAWMVQLYDHPPMFVKSGDGAYFVDVDGHRYLDMNLADTSMPFGYAEPQLTAAASEQMARGSQFMLPNEDSIAVAEQLSSRFGLPKWQFTLAGSSANTEAIRIARAITGRSDILMFAGKYHGMIDDTLVAEDGGERILEGAGISEDVKKHAHIVQFNDLDAVERSLKNHDIACVITEPALTNVGVIQPESNFHTALRELTRTHGTLLIIDEAHTNVCAFGGLSNEWKLDPDILTLCKAIGGSVAIGAYGMTEDVASILESQSDSELPSFATTAVVATGGTLFGNALSMATARCTLERVMTQQAHQRANDVGGRLADGIQNKIEAHGLPWSTIRFYCRSGYFFAPDLPANARQMQASENLPLRQLIRLYLANRGVWEAIYSASPAVGFRTTANDVDFYCEAFDNCLAGLVRI